MIAVFEQSSTPTNKATTLTYRAQVAVRQIRPPPRAVTGGRSGSHTNGNASAVTPSRASPTAVCSASQITVNCSPSQRGLHAPMQSKYPEKQPVSPLICGGHRSTVKLPRQTSRVGQSTRTIDSDHRLELSTRTNDLNYQLGPSIRTTDFDPRSTQTIDSIDSDCDSNRLEPSTLSTRIATQIDSDHRFYRLGLRLESTQTIDSIHSDHRLGPSTGRWAGDPNQSRARQERPQKRAAAAAVGDASCRHRSIQARR